MLWHSTCRNISYISGTDSQMQPLTPSLLTASSTKSHWMDSFTQRRTEATTLPTKSQLLTLARMFLTAASLSLGSHASRHTQLSDFTIHPQVFQQWETSSEVGTPITDGSKMGYELKSLFSFSNSDPSINLTWLPWWLSGQELVSQCRKLGFDPWVGKIPWRREKQPIPVFLFEKSHGQRRFGGLHSMGSQKSQTDTI